MGSRFNQHAYDHFVGSVGMAITLANLFGLAWATSSVARKKQLSAGEMLWAWSGLAWGVWVGLLLIYELPQTPVAYMQTLAIFGSFAAIAAFAAAFGPRPPEHGVMWAHWVGWGSTGV